MVLTMSLVQSAIAETVLATSKTKVYRYPDTSSSSISVPAGTTMEKIDEKGNWLKVQRAGITAYIPSDKVEAVLDCQQTKGYVVEPTPMYREYGKTEKYGKLPKNTEVTVYALAGEWAYVGIGDYKGFVQKKDLSPQKPDANTEEDNEEITLLEDQYAYTALEGAKVYKKPSASSKVNATLPVNTRLAVGAIRGDWALVGLNGFYGFMQLSSLSENKVDVPNIPDVDPEDEIGDKPSISDDVPDGASGSDSSTTAAKGTAKAMDWWTSGIQDIFARGTTATITDVATGIAWKEMRKGGTNHADTQPLTAADTAAMKAAVGEWSWTRRAIIVTIDGVNYAASMNCMPHGSGSISNNNFDGHHCIHFTNSRTHASNKVCPQHQAAIQQALSAKL